MPRISRVRSESGSYHIMIRGNNKKNIFKYEEDKEKLIEIIEKTITEDKWKLRAYCIMDNHAHLLIEENDKEVSEIMKKINITYAMYYNKKHKSIGHVFQDRYKSESVVDDAYLLTVMRYIHQNPIKAGIIKDIKDYKWSSYNEYIGRLENGITDTDLLEMLSKNKKEAIKEFIEFHKEIEDETYLEDKEEEKENEEKNAWVLIQDKISESGAVNKTELAELLLKNTKLSYRKIAEMLEINRGVVQRIGKVRKRL